MIWELWILQKNAPKIFGNLLNWNEFEFKMWSKSASDSYCVVHTHSLRFVWIHFLCWEFIFIKNHHSPNCFSQKNRIIFRNVHCLLNQEKSKFWPIYRIAMFVFLLPKQNITNAALYFSFFSLYLGVNRIEQIAEHHRIFLQISSSPNARHSTLVWGWQYDLRLPTNPKLLDFSQEY